MNVVNLLAEQRQGKLAKELGSFRNSHLVGKVFPNSANLGMLTAHRKIRHWFNEGPEEDHASSCYAEKSYLSVGRNRGQEQPVAGEFLRGCLHRQHAVSWIRLAQITLENVTVMRINVRSCAVRE